MGRRCTWRMLTNTSEFRQELELRHVLYSWWVDFIKSRRVFSEWKARRRQSGTAVCEQCSALGDRAHAVPGSEETRWKIAGIVWRQTVEQPGGIMRSPSSLMSSILIIVAGLASAGQLMSCDCIEKPGLDLKMDLESLLFFCGFRLPQCLLSGPVIPDWLDVGDQGSVGGQTNLVLLVTEDASFELLLYVWSCLDTEYILDLMSLMAFHDW